MECLLPAKWETYTGWFTAGPLEGVRRRNSVWGLRRYAGTAGSARSLALRNTASCRNTRAACAGACRIRYLRLRRAPYIFRYSLTHRTNVTSPVLNRNTRRGGGGGGGGAEAGTPARPLPEHQSRNIRSVVRAGLAYSRSPLQRRRLLICHARLCWPYPGMRCWLCDAE